MHIFDPFYKQIMKKALAVILSLIILFLSAIPCDEHDENLVKQGTETVLLDGNAHLHIDVCNPFFFCHSGHNAFVGSGTFVISYFVNKVFVQNQNPYFVETDFSTPVWNPPKA